jgi:hypothetical protein
MIIHKFNSKTMTYPNQILILHIMDLLRAIHFDILLHILNEIQEREGGGKTPEENDENNY